MSALRDRPRVAAALAILTVLLVASGWVIGMASAGGGDAGDRIRLERAELAITAAQREVRDLRQQTGRLQVRAGELEQQRTALARRARRADALTKRWRQRARRVERRARRRAD